MPKSDRLRSMLLRKVAVRRLLIVTVLVISICFRKKRITLAAPYDNAKYIIIRRFKNEIDEVLFSQQAYPAGDFVAAYVEIDNGGVGGESIQ